MTQKIQERYQNFTKALKKLVEIQARFEDLIDDDERSIFRDSLIQRFEFTVELAKNLQRDVLKDKEVEDEKLATPKDIFSESFKIGLLDDYEIWFKMIKSRNLSSHTYNEDLAEEMTGDIITLFTPELTKFKQKVETKYGLS